MTIPIVPTTGGNMTFSITTVEVIWMVIGAVIWNVIGGTVKSAIQKLVAPKP